VHCRTSFASCSRCRCYGPTLLIRSLQQLECDELESALLQSADQFTDQTALHTCRQKKGRRRACAVRAR
jgi:hypothetical protein